MTSLVIAEGWTMTGDGPRAGGDWRNWRGVVAAWSLAAVLAGGLLLSVPRHDHQNLPTSLWSLSPGAGTPARARASDAEGPTDTQACSDRDYANERC